MRSLSILAVFLAIGCSRKPSEAGNAEPEIKESHSSNSVSEIPLYTDEEVDQIGNANLIERHADYVVVFRVNFHESIPRAKVFKKLNINENRLRFADWAVGNMGGFFRWQISPSYHVSCKAPPSGFSILKGINLEDSKHPPDAGIQMFEAEVHFSGH